MKNNQLANAYNLHRSLRRLAAGENGKKGKLAPKDVFADAIYRTALSLNINSFCYYHFHETQNFRKVVSFFGRGFDELISKRINLGALARYDQREDGRIQPTFLSILERKPFRITLENDNDPNDRQSLYGLECIHIKSTDSDFPIASELVYFDLPIFLGDSIYGKIVCSASTKKEKSFGNIKSFWNLCLMAAPYFQFIAKKVFRLSHESFHEVRATLDESSSLAEMYKRCVTKLPALIGNASNASIFAVVSDSLEQKRLVLQASSWPAAEKVRHAQPYKLDTASLTGYCAYSKCPIRLHSFEDSELLAQQLKEYHPQLAWRNQISDSSQHKSFLAVPIISASGECLGVIRFTQNNDRTNGKSLFSETDEEIALEVAKVVIAPNIERLRRLQYADGFLAYSEKLHMLALTGALIKTQDIESRLCQVVHDLISTSGHGKKLVILSLIEKEQNFRIQAIAGGILTSLREGDLHQMDGSLSSFALNVGRGILLTDLGFAAKHRKYRNMTADALSAVSAPIQFLGERKYGTITVLSDRNDLGDVERQTLELIGVFVSDHYAKQEFRLDSLAAAGIRHDVDKFLVQVDHHLRCIVSQDMVNNDAEESSKQVASALEKLEVATHFLDVYLNPNRLQSAPNLVKLTECDVIRDVVKPAVAAAKWYCSDKFDLNLPVIGQSAIRRIHRSPLISILYNLLKNALDYGDEGTCSISVTSVADTVRFEVSNETDSLLPPVAGEIINSEELTAWLVKNWTIREEQTPIGLLLCKGIAALYELHDRRRAKITYTHSGRTHIFCLDVPVPYYYEKENINN